MELQGGARLTRLFRVDEVEIGADGFVIHPSNPYAAGHRLLEVLLRDRAAGRRRVEAADRRTRAQVMLAYLERGLTDELGWSRSPVALLGPNAPEVGSGTNPWRLNRHLEDLDWLSRLGREKLEFEPADVPLLARALRAGKLDFRIIIRPGYLVKAIEIASASGLDDEQRQAVLDLLDAGVRTSEQGPSSRRKHTARVQAVAGVTPPAIETIDPWGLAVSGDLAGFDDRGAWQALLQHCASLRRADPPRRWLSALPALTGALEADALDARLRAWFCLIQPPRSRKQLPVMAPNDAVLRGLVWVAASHAELVPEVGSLARRCYTKIPDYGPVCPLVGNACIKALGEMAGLPGLAELDRLHADISYESAAALIAGSLERGRARLPDAERDALSTRPALESRIEDRRAERARVHSDRHRGFRRLRRAVDLGSLRRLRRGLADGANPDAIDPDRPDEEEYILGLAVRMAPARGSIDLVKALVEAGADLHRQDRPSGDTALHYAVFGSTELVRYLVARGADVEARNSRGRTPLHEAAYSMIAPAASLDTLLDLGADIEARCDAEGSTALHLAVCGSLGQPGKVRLLIRRGADVDARCARGMTAWEMCERARCSLTPGNGPAIAAILLDAGASTERHADAARDELFKTLVALETRGREKPNMLVTGLSLLASSLSAETGDAMAHEDRTLEPPSDSVARASAALLEPALRRRAARLVRGGALGPDPFAQHVDGVPILEHLARNGAPEVMAALFEVGGPSSSPRALIEAARNGHLECARLLVAAGTPARDPDPDSSMDPLSEAVRADSMEIVELLLAAGARPRAIGPHEATGEKAQRVSAIMRRAAGEKLRGRTVKVWRQPKAPPSRRAGLDGLPSSLISVHGASVEDIAAMRTRALGGATWTKNAHEHLVPHVLRFEAVFRIAGHPWCFLLPASTFPPKYLLDSQLAAAIAEDLGTEVVWFGCEPEQGTSPLSFDVRAEHHGLESVRRGRWRCERHDRFPDQDWFADHDLFIPSCQGGSDGLKCEVGLTGVRRDEIERLDIVVVERDPWDDPLHRGTR